MKYLQKAPFSAPPPSDAFRSGWDACFGTKPKGKTMAKKTKKAGKGKGKRALADISGRIS